MPPGIPAALASVWQEALDVSSAEKAMRGHMARGRVIKHFSLQRLLEGEDLRGSSQCRDVSVLARTSCRRNFSLKVLM